MEYRFSAELKNGYLHVRVEGDNNVSTVLRWVTDGLEACRKHRCNRVLVEEYLEGESLSDGETFTVVAEAARAAREHVSHMAYIDANPEHRKDMLTFAKYVADLRGVNMRVFDNVRDAEAWLTRAPAGGEDR